MSSSSTKSMKLRDEFANRLNRFRRKIWHRPNATSSHPRGSDKTSSSINGSSPPVQVSINNGQSSTNVDNVVRAQTSQGVILAHQTCPDIWSAAYREAIESFGKDINVAIFKGSSAAQLFRQLEEIDKDASQESAFIRGVAFLRSIQIPLERFKLALDLASPLSNLEPTAATVVGVVKSVTAIAITFATADLEFAKHIGEMLEQLSYIDDCDTLGQRSNRQDIHKALVSVYQKVLEFYQVAHEILTRKGAKLVMKMVLETDRLPNVVQDFLKYADILRKLIEKATLEVVEDIKTMLYDHDIGSWLGSGKVSQQSRYHADLQQLRADQACTFLLAHPEFKKWYDASDHEWLVIFGDMGHGKTIAMSFIIDELHQRNEHQLPQPKLFYHYCRDDETGDTSYIASALILALLQQLPGLKKTFHVWYKAKQASRNLDPVTNTRELVEFLETTVVTLDRPLFVIIDGLDECSRASRKALLKLLRTLSQTAPKLKVMVSSRPEKEIVEQLHNISRIDLGSNTQRDAVIVQHIVEHQLSYLSEDVKTLIISRLSHSAQGSAIWTKMMVTLIEIRRIESLEPMRNFLEEMFLPDKLSDLYVSMVARYSSDDIQNKTLTTTALKLLAFACRPLSIEELAWAVTLAVARDKVNSIASLARLVDAPRIFNLIHPFITHPDFDDLKKRQIRLVHQSIKEFVIQDWHLLPDPNSPPTLSQMNANERIESLKSFILDTCIDYLLLDEIGNFHLFSEEQVAIDELPQEFDLFRDTGSFEYDQDCTWEVWEENMIHYEPSERGFGHFFVYAASHWLTHFGTVRKGCLPRLMKVENLCRVDSLRLHNWIKQNCRPDCAIKARFEFDSNLYDPLGITSLYGSNAMLYTMIENSSFDTDIFLNPSAICAADQIFQWGDLSRLELLFFDARLGRQLQTLEFFQLMIRQWTIYDVRHDNWNVAFALVDHVSDRLVQEQWGRELLCVAARAGCMPMIQRLLNKAQRMEVLESELQHGFQSIGEAVAGNCIDVVKCLLKQEGFAAHVHHVNSYGENVLHLASKNCNPAIFHLLVPRLPEGINGCDEKGDTVLMRIVKSHSNSGDRNESAKILLASQTDVDWGDHITDEHDPLRMAIRLGDVDMCRLLIRDGKISAHSALIRGNDGQLTLKDKPMMHEAAILQLLSQSLPSL